MSLVRYCGPRAELAASATIKYMYPAAARREIPHDVVDWADALMKQVGYRRNEALSGTLAYAKDSQPMML